MSNLSHNWIWRAYLEKERVGGSVQISQLNINTHWLSGVWLIHAHKIMLGTIMAAVAVLKSAYEKCRTGIIACITFNAITYTISKVG